MSYCWDGKLFERGVLQARYAIPYSDLQSLSEAEREVFIERGEPLEFGHSIEDQIGGQIAAGFSITGFYEDKWGGGHLEDQFFPHFMATRALKSRTTQAHASEA